ncbi:MAG: class I SAM-dependent methyltransferase [Clostridiales Family XIII bacterium]|nr:class I SAM-dependent methyltransferase [Clostridiales Family XIII bacterium]
MKYAIYGLGRYFMGHQLGFVGILKNALYISDSNPDRRMLAKRLFHSATVVEPDIIIQNESILDKVYIAAPLHFDEIASMLTDAGMAPGKIELLEPDKNMFLTGDVLAEARMLIGRESSLKFMPDNAVCVEVGVAYGDFTEMILREMKPKMFFAVDCFSRDDPYVELMGRCDFKRDNMPHQKWYERRFSREIASGLLETRQGFSWDVLSEFPDDYFDYAYVDAGHDYESVKNDIAVLEKKLKDGGFVQFNDYAMFNWAWGIFFGVVPAVNEFLNLNKGNHKVRYFCMDDTHQNNDIVIQIHKNGTGIL